MFLFHLHPETEKEKLLKSEPFLRRFPMCLRCRKMYLVNGGLSVNQALPLAKCEG